MARKAASTASSLLGEKPTVLGLKTLSGIQSCVWNVYGQSTLQKKKKTTKEGGGKQPTSKALR